MSERSNGVNRASVYLFSATLGYQASPEVRWQLPANSGVFPAVKGLCEFPQPGFPLLAVDNLNDCAQRRVVNKDMGNPQDEEGLPAPGKIVECYDGKEAYVSATNYDDEARLKYDPNNPKHFRKA